MAILGWIRDWVSARKRTLSAGQSLVIVALAFIGLLAFVGFAVDAGILFMHRVWLRGAADAAALAGAFELPNENAACARVVNYLEYQGYSPGADFNFKLIFPEGSELDAYPSIPSSPTRVIDSPSMSTCSSLSIAGDHFEVWVTADQELGTFFLGLVGLNRVTTGQPAVAQKPEAFDVVFVIPNPDSMRTDTCLYERADDSYLASPDFYGNSYGCTYPHSSVSQIDAIANPGFETGLSGWAFPPMKASISNDDFHSGSAALKLRQPSPPCTPYAQCPRISQTFTTEATDLYLAFWLKPLSMETSYTNNQAPDFLNLEVRWDTDGDGTVDSSTIWPLIVQWCDPESGSPECRFCPDQFMGGSYNYGDLQGRQYYCEARINAAANSTGWKYAVVEIPSGAWSSPGPATIEIKFVLQSKKSPGPDPEDAVLIDDVALYSAPWLQGPRARYILDTDAEGRAACNNVNYWPNCDNTWNPIDPPPPYGSNYTPPDVLFPARGLMQQPLYDVLLAIGKDPAMGGPDSFMDMLGAGHRFGFVLYHMTTYLTGCIVNGNPSPHNNAYFQSGGATYADFRYWLFNGISSYMPDITNCGTGGGGNNHAGGIAGARKFLNTYGREDTNRTIVLLSHRTIDINCGEASDTYCYGQTACSTPECLENAKYWLDRQVQYAASEGITIFTIGIGREADMELMQRMAEPTGGTWYHASSTSELPLRFRQIYEDMKRMVRLTR